MRKINLLSVVIPCHNEQEVLLATYKRLSGILDNLITEKRCAGYELVYVDDGSTDDTLQSLEQIFETDKHVKIISLRHNSGHQGAISAGMYYAQGGAVVTIDADLQDPPEKIEEMISYFEKGYDLVLGVRKDRSSDLFLKRFFAQSYYRLIKLMGVEVVYNHGDFRLMAKPLVNEFNNLPERNRFIRAMILNLESRYAIVYYDREPRRGGQSKYTAKAMFSFCFDGIVSFSYVPLRLASIFGIFMCFLAMLGAIWVVYTKYSQNIVPGWASILVPVFAFSGIQLFVLGLIGEYIGRLYVEVKQRPLFVVRKEYMHNILQEDEMLK